MNRPKFRGLKRPVLTPAIIKALGSVRAAAQLDWESNEDAEERKQLSRGIRYIDALRDWFWDGEDPPKDG